MILTKSRCPRRNERKLRRAALALTAVLVVAMGGLIVLASRASAEGKTTAACVAYAVLVSFFLGALLWGFVLSQSRYSESVEEPKFDLLRKEEAEWKR